MSSALTTWFSVCLRHHERQLSVMCQSKEQPTQQNVCMPFISPAFWWVSHLWLLSLHQRSETELLLVVSATLFVFQWENHMHQFTMFSLRWPFLRGFYKNSMLCCYLEIIAYTYANPSNELFLLKFATFPLPHSLFHFVSLFNFYWIYC